MHVLATGNGSASPVLGFVIWGAAFIAYWTPAIVALIRQVPNTGSVIVVDFLLGWTGVGWIVALAMACRSKPRYAQPPPGYYPPAPSSGYYPPQP